MLTVENIVEHGEEYFPFTPYAIQREFLSKFDQIASAARKNEHANIGILESPTGTVVLYHCVGN